MPLLVGGVALRADRQSWFSRVQPEGVAIHTRHVHAHKQIVTAATNIDRKADALGRTENLLCQPVALGQDRVVAGSIPPPPACASGRSG
jgi:hypothetical protein